jgi:DMSO/TMAO reductase YedYZ heme-binding membrane subunit
MTAHLVLIVWLWFFVIREPIPILLLVGGGGAYAMLLLMLITSFDSTARALGPRNWRRLHKVGLYWIGAVFANTIVPDVVREPQNPFYLLTALLMLAAIAVRVLAWYRRRRASPKIA